MAIPGARYAFQVVAPASPVLRVRYRKGVAVDPYGFPDWVPYARALVQLPPGPPGLGLDEARVADVVTANRTMAGDPLWSDPFTPFGWTWAHLPRERQIALVPADLHGCYRHLGGVSTGTADRSRRGLTGADRPAPPVRPAERLAPEVVDALDAHLGPLPPRYRAFLAATNGGVPTRPAVHPGFGFVADQPFFGLARTDRLQELAYANAWFGDRFTADFLAIGYVQGGLLAVKVRGGDEDSVWYWDDDDHRDTEDYTATEVCAQLLHRCADHIDGILAALREIPEHLTEPGDARPLYPDRLGADLPPALRRAAT